MEWTTAGVLPVAVLDNNKHFLFGKCQEQWSDFGGLRKNKLPVRLLAAKTASDISYGELGSPKDIEKRLALADRVAAGSHRCFFTPCGGSKLHTLPERFAEKQANNEKASTFSEVTWIKCDDVFKAIATAAPGAKDVSVQGTPLRARLLSAIRRSDAFLDFMHKNPKFGKNLAAMAGVQVLKLIQGLPASKNLADGLRYYVVLSGPDGKAGKVFRVNDRSGPSKKWKIEEVTYDINSKYNPGLIERTVDLVRKQSGMEGTPPSEAERMAIFHAVNNIPYFPRFANFLFRLRCSFPGVPLVTGKEKTLLEDPLEVNKPKKTPKEPSKVASSG